jgi:predicted transposase YdaD
MAAFKFRPPQGRKEGREEGREEGRNQNEKRLGADMDMTCEL